jgi:hypothetical protein
LATNLWKDPGTWGIMLVDLAKHIALSYEQATGQNAASVLRKIKKGFDAEWGSPTDEPTGSVGH